MAVDETSLERIRKATFPDERRGYDKREVEKFLNRLADWLETGGGDQARSDTVRRELERVGQRTGAILAEAEQSAQEIRGEAEQEAQELRAQAAADADQTRKEADAYAAEARAGADAYAKETREKADAYATETRQGAADHSAESKAQAEQQSRETIAAGEAQAQRTIAEGVSRRSDVESLISDLAGNRDKVIAEMEELGGALADAVGRYKPSAGNDAFATPEELDPLARDGEGEVEELAQTELVDIEANGDSEEVFDAEPDDEADLDGNEAAEEIEDEKSQSKRGRRRKTSSSKSKG
ncbi:MAG: DivIVA protein [Solirubrobacterales bacterium]|nr:DivIVA protein [Solirubrobacterales bacterium]